MGRSPPLLLTTVQPSKLNTRAIQGAVRSCVLLEVWVYLELYRIQAKPVNLSICFGLLPENGAERPDPRQAERSEG